MNVHRLQVLISERFYDQKIAAAEKEDIEILSSVVRGSRLHEGIHSPIDSGIDDG